MTDKGGVKTRSTAPTEAELYLLQERVLAKEQQLKSQAEAIKSEADSLRAARLELEQEKIRIEQEQASSSIPNVAELKQTILQLQNELRDQRNQVGQEPQRGSPTDVVSSSPPRQDSHPTSTSSQMPRLRDALETIPAFDGYKIPVHQFCRACLRAREMLPSHLEVSLIQMTVNKLQGHAFLAVEDLTFVTVADLCEHLKNTFAPVKSLNQYRGELGNIFQKTNEHVLDYIARVKELKMAVREGEEKLQGSLTQSVEENLKAEVLEAFVRGLKPEIALRLKVEGLEDFDKAVLKTVQLSKIIETEKARYKTPFWGNRNNFNGRPSPSPSPSGDSNSNRNYRNQNNTSSNSQVPSTSQTTSRTPIVCNYCKYPGHVIGECRKLKYKEEQAQRQNSTSGNGERGPRVNGGPRETPRTRHQVNAIQVEEVEEMGEVELISHEQPLNESLESS